MATKKKTTKAAPPKKKKPAPPKPKSKAVAKKKTAAPAKKKSAPVAAKKKAAAAKPVKKVAAKKKTTTTKAAPATKPVARRDATGHLNPKYARDLAARSRASRDDDQNDRAFLGKSKSKDDLAEELGEQAVATMTSGEDQSDRFEQEVEEESGGPFVKTRRREELAPGTDKSNPRSATREPFPTT